MDGLLKVILAVAVVYALYRILYVEPFDNQTNTIIGIVVGVALGVVLLGYVVYGVVKWNKFLFGKLLL